VSIELTLILVVFFLCAEGFFSGSEIALVSFSRIRLMRLADDGEKFAITLENMLKSPERVFGTTSVGTNLSVFAASAVVTASMVEAFGEKADLYSFLIMGPVTLILGEIVPKAIFRYNAEALWPFAAKPLELAQRLFKPVLAVTTVVSQFVLKRIFLQREVSATIITREEILLLARLNQKKLELDTEEKKMIDRIFEFKTSCVETAMQPLINIAAVSESTTLSQAKAIIAETGYSRLPVYHDRIFNIVGIVSAFDILRQADLNAQVVKIMSPAYYTPYSKKNSELLKEMQESGVHMSVVVDEYGAAIGVITNEDLLEEIVGEIEDEYDQPVKSYEILGAGRYLFDASIEIDSINEELDLNLPTGDYETLAGFLMEAIEDIPKKGAKIGVGAYLFIIMDADRRKIKSVELTDLRKSSGDPEGKTDSPDTAGYG